jgi:hypothetical protein
MNNNKNIKDNSVLPDNLVLELPDTGDYQSTPQEVSYLDFMKLCEQELPYTNAKNLEERKKYVHIEPFTFKD